MSVFWYVNGCFAVALIALGDVASRALTVPTPEIAYTSAATQLAPLPDAGPGFSPDLLTAFSATLAKPVFSPTRSPAPQAAKTEEVVSAKLKDLALRGILVEGGLKTALFWSDQKGEALSFGLNDKIGGWTVMEMTPKSVILARDGEHMNLPLTIKAVLAGGDKDKASGPSARRGTQEYSRNRSSTQRRSVDGAAFLLDDDS